MLKKNRNKLEIIKDMLGAILLNRNISPTNLLYKANLSPNMFKDYTEELLEKGLIKDKIIPGRTNLDGKKLAKDHRTFNLTELGREFLEDYKAVDLFLEKYELNEEE